MNESLVPKGAGAGVARGAGAALAGLAGAVEVTGTKDLTVGSAMDGDQQPRNLGFSWASLYLSYTGGAWLLV